jgi:hypothetical protein
MWVVDKATNQECKNHRAMMLMIRSGKMSYLPSMEDVGGVLLLLERFGPMEVVRGQQ